MAEEREIPGCKDYFATDEGELYSVREGFRKKISQFADRRGYFHATVRRGVGDKTRWTTRVHILILTAFKGPKPSPELECRHLDGDKTNNRPSNLEWGTREENNEDRRRHGWPRKRFFTPEQARERKQAYYWRNKSKIQAKAKAKYVAIREKVREKRLANLEEARAKARQRYAETKDQLRRYYRKKAESLQLSGVHQIDL